MIEKILSSLNFQMRKHTHSHDDSPCIICGRKYLDPRFMVHIHGGSGSMIVTEEEATLLNAGDETSADMGMYPICEDCLNEYPEIRPYVQEPTIPIGEPGSIPRTKKEAYQRLRAIAPAGTTIQVAEPYIYGPRDRLLTFMSISSRGVQQDITPLISRIWDMPFTDIPGKQGEQALHAWDTGSEVGSALVGQLAFKLYRRHTAYRYIAAPVDRSL